MSGRSRSGARGPLLVLVALAASFAFAQAWDYATKWPGIDYYQFWVVGDAVHSGEAGDIYTPQERRRLGELYLQRFEERAQDSDRPSKRRSVARERGELETFSTPWLYTLFGVTGSGRLARDLARFQWTSLLAYVAAVVWIARRQGYAWGACIALVPVLLHAFGPYVSDESCANVGRVQVGGLAVFLGTLTLGRRAIWRWGAGVCLGLGVAFKPNLAAVALVLAAGWALTGQWRKLVQVATAALAAAGFAVAASSAYFGGASAWKSWLGSLDELLAPGAWQDVNASLARALREQLGVASSAWLGPLVLAACAAALIAGRKALVARLAAPGAELFERRFDLLLAGVGAMAGLLAAELAWLHYYVLAVPLLLCLLSPPPERAGRVQWALGLVAFVLIAGEPLRQLFGFALEVQLALTAAGGALAFALGCWSIARGLPSSREAAAA